MDLPRHRRLIVREIKGLNPTFDAGQIRGILKLISGYAKFMFYIF